MEIQEPPMRARIRGSDQTYDPSEMSDDVDNDDS